MSKEHIFCPDSGLEQVPVEEVQQPEDDHTHDLHRLADDGCPHAEAA
jgi:hypothetical protein